MIADSLDEQITIFEQKDAKDAKNSRTVHYPVGASSSALPGIVSAAPTVPARSGRRLILGSPLRDLSDLLFKIRLHRARQKKASRGSGSSAGAPGETFGDFLPLSDRAFVNRQKLTFFKPRAAGDGRVRHRAIHEPRTRFRPRHGFLPATWPDLGRSLYDRIDPTRPPGFST
jgi:hypothetical protein